MQKVTVYDIQSFDPGFGMVLLEFQALVERKKNIQNLLGKKIHPSLTYAFGIQELRIFTLILPFLGIQIMLLLLHQIKW